MWRCSSPVSHFPQQKARGKTPPGRPILTATDPRRGCLEEVQNARAEIADRLADNPSLRPWVPELFDQAWPRAGRQALDALHAFGEVVEIPTTCPYSLEQALNDGFPLP